MPGRPPRTAEKSPIKNAEYNPINGETPATNANAIASGTSARATVKPERTSSFTDPDRGVKKLSMKRPEREPHRNGWRQSTTNWLNSQPGSPQRELIVTLVNRLSVQRSTGQRDRREVGTYPRAPSVTPGDAWSTLADACQCVSLTLMRVSIHFLRCNDSASPGTRRKVAEVRATSENVACERYRRFRFGR